MAPEESNKAEEPNSNIEVSNEKIGFDTTSMHSMVFEPEDVPEPPDRKKLIDEIDIALYNWMENPDDREYPIPGIIVRCRAKEIALRKRFRGFSPSQAH